jgi:hypothetical protein
MAGRLRSRIFPCLKAPVAGAAPVLLKRKRLAAISGSDDAAAGALRVAFGALKLVPHRLVGAEAYAERSMAIALYFQKDYFPVAAIQQPRPNFLE